MDRKSVIDAAWNRAAIVSNVRKAVSSLSKTERLEVLMQIVAEDFPEEAPNRIASLTPEEQRTFQALSSRRSTRDETKARNEKVFSKLTSHPKGMTTNELSRKLNLGRQLIWYSLMQLEREGRAERINSKTWRKSDKWGEASDTKELKEPKDPATRKPRKSNVIPIESAQRNKIDGRRAAIFQFVNGSDGPVTIPQIMKTIDVPRKIIANDLRIMQKLKMVSKTVEWINRVPSNKYSKGTKPFDAAKLCRMNTKLAQDVPSFKSRKNKSA